MSGEEAFDRGFDSGNYDGAYAGEYQTNVPCGMGPQSAAAYRRGYVCGFYSSYEIHEIDNDIHAYVVAKFRKEGGVL